MQRHECTNYIVYGTTNFFNDQESLDLDQIRRLYYHFWMSHQLPYLENAYVDPSCYYATRSRHSFERALPYLLQSDIVTWSTQVSFYGRAMMRDDHRILSLFLKGIKDVSSADLCQVVNVIHTFFSDALLQYTLDNQSFHSDMHLYITIHTMNTPPEELYTRECGLLEVLSLNDDVNHVLDYVSICVR